MTDPIVVPPLVAETVRSALTERDRRRGVDGMTRTAALTAAELAASPVTTPDVVQRVASWHQQHPEHTTSDGRSTVLGGVWGGRAGRDWALEMATRLAEPWVEPRTAAADDPDVGVMVALYPDPETAARLALAGHEKPDELHMTLAYYGDSRELGEAARELLTEAVMLQAKEWSGPITGEVAGLARFNGGSNPGGDGENHALVALVDLPALPPFRQSIVRNTEAAGVLVNRKHGFIPHITLAYLDPDEATPLVTLPPVPLSFDAVWVVWADEKERYPLTGQTDGTQVAAISDALPIIRDPAPSTTPRKLRRLSKRLNRIDRDLQASLRGGAEHALTDALRRAGVKVAQRAQRRSRAVQASVELAEGRWTTPLLAAVGITEQEALAHAFDTYAAQARKRLADAQRRRLQAVAEELDLDADELEGEYGPRLEERRDSAVGYLLTGLTALAFSRLAEPDPAATAEGEAASSAVPLSLIYNTTAISDGRPMDGPGADGPGTLGEGEVSVDPFGRGFTLEIVAANVEDVTEVISWEWGGGGVTEFPPHSELDGTTVAVSEMEDVWGKSPEEFPYGTTYWYPSDHLGCSCSWESTLVLPTDGAEGE